LAVLISLDITSSALANSSKKRSHRDSESPEALSPVTEYEQKRPKVDADSLAAMPLYTPDTPSLNTARKILDILQRRKHASVRFAIILYYFYFLQYYYF
jgi:hypothetical protein